MQNSINQTDDPWALPIESLDVSDPALFASGRHHEYFRRLRAESPIHFCKASPFGSYWSIAKFNDIYDIERDHKRFTSRYGIVIGDTPPDFATPSFIAFDQPKHDVQRNVVQPAVLPKNLNELEPLIRKRVAEILDGLPVGEEFDWVEHVSIELTTRMLATLFNFPFEERHKLPYWSDMITNSTTHGNDDADMEERKRVLFECLEYFTQAWHARAAAPPAMDFISLLAHHDDTKDLVEERMEYLGTLMLLIVGGNDTTRNSISGGVVALNRNPDQYAKLKSDPNLIRKMVGEIIRYQTPLSHMRRTACEDIEFRGHHIRKGDKVIMWYASGNRDDEVIDQPDKFIIDRSRSNHHLSFGFGIHRCMGSRVAEMQLRILWEEILKRFDSVEMVGEPETVSSNFVMGFEKLPVRLHAKS